MVANAPTCSLLNRMTFGLWKFRSNVLVVCACGAVFVCILYIYIPFISSLLLSLLVLNHMDDCVSKFASLVTRDQFDPLLAHPIWCCVSPVNHSDSVFVCFLVTPINQCLIILRRCTLYTPVGLQDEPTCMRIEPV